MTPLWRRLFAGDVERRWLWRGTGRDQPGTNGDHQDHEDHSGSNGSSNGDRPVPLDPDQDGPRSLMPDRPWVAEDHWSDRDEVQVVPDFWRDPRTAVSLAVQRAKHWVKFHTLRLPIYAARNLLWAPRGLSRLTSGLWHWVTDYETRGVIWDVHQHARETGDWAQYHRVVQAREARVRPRRVAVLFGTMALAGAGYMVLMDPVLLVLVVPLVVLVLGYQGRPMDRPYIESSVVSAPEARKITPDMVLMALHAAGLCRETIGPDAPEIVAPGVHRDGPGFGAIVDLPLGYTGQQAIKKAVGIAAGLRISDRRLTVELNTGPQGHAGQIKLWIADEDPLSRSPKPSPLIEASRFDIWGKVPFGRDVKGQTVSFLLLWTNILIGALPRMGKALALDTKVPTPNGWTTMGELEDGDVVFDDRGQPCHVVKAWPVQHDRPCYEVRFSDGTVIVADADHQWEVETRTHRVDRRNAGRMKVLTTAEMVDSVRVEEAQRANYSIRVTQPLQGDPADLLVPPYTLGAWLGDGTNVTGVITCADHGIVDEIRAEGEAVTVKPCTAANTAPEYRVAGLTARLRTLGLLSNKHIPLECLRASESQRRALLAGLLDTDGWCEKWGTVLIGVREERLARDILHLVSTLGYKATLRRKPVRVNQQEFAPSWLVTLMPGEQVFRLARKAERQSQHRKASNRRRYITDIRPVPSVPVRCITVDSPSSLYLVTEACIPTHNTFVLRLLVAAAALDPHVRLLLWDGKGGKDHHPFEQVCHAFGAGAADEVAKALLATVTGLVRDMDERYKKMSHLPVAKVPDGRLTPALAKDRKLDMPVTLLAIDEFQVYLQNERYGKDILKGLTVLAARGPAAGIILALATQRPSAKVMPTEFRDLFGTRIALRMVTDDASEMILGGGSSRAGWNTSRFRATDKGVCILLGADEGELVDKGGQVVQAHLMDLPAATKVVARARALREGAGTLSGVAAGEEPEALSDQVLEHVAAAFEGEEKAHSEVLCARMAATYPGLYETWDQSDLAAALGRFGIAAGNQTWATPVEGGAKCNRKGFALKQVLDVLVEKAGEVPDTPPETED